MSFCRMCGRDPCVNPSFCATCRRADAIEKLKKESAEILRARRLLADDVSFERAWHELNDPRNHPTPRAEIEAVLYCVRQRGLAALKEPANIHRLARCDARAKAHIDQRIKKLIERKEITR